MRRNTTCSPTTDRRGFTLVELLVVVVIIGILVSLTVGAFRTDDKGRLSNAARTLQSSISGMRSLATADQKVRGLRFIPRANDPRVASSFVPIGQPDDLTGYLSLITVNVMVPADPGDDVWVIRDDTPGVWSRLAPPTTANPNGRNLLRVGARVEIPNGSGQWYTLTATQFDPWGNWLSITGHQPPANWNATLGRMVSVQEEPTLLTPPQPGTPMPYRMELAPTLLAGEEPQSLPDGIVIDIDASQVPQSWRAGGDWDILFQPNGAMRGYTGGSTHLYITRVADLEMTRNLVPTHPANGGTHPLPIVPSNRPAVPAEEPRLMTIPSTSGVIYAAMVNFDDPDGDLVANTPFTYAATGRQLDH